MTKRSKPSRQVRRAQERRIAKQLAKKERENQGKQKAEETQIPDEPSRKIDWKYIIDKVLQGLLILSNFFKACGQAIANRQSQMGSINRLSILHRFQQFVISLQLNRGFKRYRECYRGNASLVVDFTSERHRYCSYLQYILTPAPAAFIGPGIELCLKS